MLDGHRPVLPVEARHHCVADGGTGNEQRCQRYQSECAIEHGPLCGLLRPLGDLGDGRTTTASGGLYRALGLAGIMRLMPSLHSTFLCPALVEAFRLRFGPTLGLPATPVLVIRAGDGGEHVEQHAIDGLEHPAGELVGGLSGHRPKRG
jgi:hypothetical protein